MVHVVMSFLVPKHEAQASIVEIDIEQQQEQEQQHQSAPNHGEVVGAVPAADLAFAHFLLPSILP